jgi:hypothetical protein
MGELSRRLGVAPEALLGGDRSWQVARLRAAVLYVLVRRLGHPAGRVAAAFGRDPATVSTLISRLARRFEGAPLLAMLAGAGAEPGSREMDCRSPRETAGPRPPGADCSDGKA